MADIKISALPTATTPLTGAELVPIVQGAVTKQTTTSDLLAVPVTSLTASSAVATDASKKLVSVANTGTGSNVLATGPTLTLPNATGLPIAGLTPSTSTSLGVGSIELGHATDTSITRVSPGVVAIESSNIVTAASLAGGTLPASVTTLTASSAITGQVTKTTNNITWTAANLLAAYNSTSVPVISLAAGTHLTNGQFDVTTSLGIDFSVNAVKSAISDLVINSTITADAAVNLSQTGIKDFRITDNYIRALTYAVLVNYGSNNLTRGIINSNIITSDSGDAIELNVPPTLGGSCTSVSVVGNVLSSLITGSGTGAGFAIGLAGAQGISAVGNTISESRLEAFHYEDAQHTNVIVGNTALKCADSGAKFFQQVTSPYAAEGVVVVGNSFRADTSNTKYGIEQTWTPEGSVPDMTVIGNKVVNFGTGLLIGIKDTVAHGNMLVGSSGVNAIISVGGKVFGENNCRGYSTLANTVNPAIIGKINSATQPTKVLDVSGHPANTSGSTLKGFSLPVFNVSIPTASTTQVTVCPAPKKMCGNFIVKVLRQGNTQFVDYFVHIYYDGTTITLTESNKNNYGIIDVSTSFTISGGNLLFGVYNAAGATIICDCWFDFDGYYYANL